MKLDLVHDIQNSYRKVLNCMSRPGVIENIKEESEKTDIDIRFYKQTLVLMFMLLDAQVSYKIISKREKEISLLVNQLTYAKEQSADEADFIFVLEDADNEMMEEAMRAAKIGNLIDPHKSASIIFETQKIDNNRQYVLKGPGIKNESYLSIDVKVNWLIERQNKITEYPLGIDIIFVDRFSNIVCMPRTTQIQKYEGVK